MKLWIRTQIQILSSSKPIRKINQKTIYTHILQWFSESVYMGKHAYVSFRVFVYGLCRSIRPKSLITVVFVSELRDINRNKTVKWRYPRRLGWNRVVCRRMKKSQEQIHWGVFTFVWVYENCISFRVRFICMYFSHCFIYVWLCNSITQSKAVAMVQQKGTVNH